jgi:hypothetical protein
MDALIISMGVLIIPENGGVYPCEWVVCRGGWRFWTFGVAGIKVPEIKSSSG